MDGQAGMEIHGGTDCRRMQQMNLEEHSLHKPCFSLRHVHGRGTGHEVASLLFGGLDLDFLGLGGGSVGVDGHSISHSVEQTDVARLIRSLCLLLLEGDLGGF